MEFLVNNYFTTAKAMRFTASWLVSLTERFISFRRNTQGEPVPVYGFVLRRLHLLSTIPYWLWLIFKPFWSKERRPIKITTHQVVVNLKLPTIFPSLIESIYFLFYKGALLVCLQKPEELTNVVMCLLVTDQSFLFFQFFPTTLPTWQQSSSRLPGLMVNLNNTQNEYLQE